jgi:enediyne biosynthesis protein E4
MRYLKLGLLIIAGLVRCSSETNKQPLFIDVTHDSGVDFTNNLAFTSELNPYTYRNFYNGSGVAIGDINNDGLLDIYFTGNQVGSKLYLNTGNFNFTDITDKAGVGTEGSWSTGVTMADINADGFLDIYVCKSGAPNSPKRHNELFINNGDLTFTEMAHHYGLDVVGLSVQSAFFDYDRDGDLDCYLLTNSFKSIGNFDLIKDRRFTPDPNNGGNKFFINDNGKFIDFTKQAGIFNSEIGFGLGITLGDFSEDGWTDIYISNDFFERDYLYINNKNGTFTESLTEYFESISAGSMGADFADLDGDGFNELLVTEMLPDSLERKKTKIHFESWEKHNEAILNGYHYQFARNTLQKKVSKGVFKEIGRMTGMAATEWSWGALLLDMNNDGMRDVFIANGIYKDLLDRDYLNYSVSSEATRELLSDKKNGILRLIDKMPSSQFINYAFQNKGDLEFSNVSVKWGFDQPMFSSGAAYGDLDNDGDLDLVISNINSHARLYKNNSDTSEYRSVTFSFRSKTSNSKMVGTKVEAFVNGKLYTGDNFTVRGYQSSVQPLITIGVGGSAVLDSIIVHWPNGTKSISYQLPTNRNHLIEFDSSVNIVESSIHHDFSTFCMEQINSKIKHAGSGFSDFDRDRLLPAMYGTEMPKLVKCDIDSDGIAEIYMGGGKGQAGTLIQFKNGIKYHHPFNDQELVLSEETKGYFFDVDNDNDLDFYFASGGRFFPIISHAQEDKILLNVGQGKYVASEISLPLRNFSTSFALAFDFDRDGDKDLLVAERFDPFRYGIGGRGYLLRNEGAGEFSDVTQKYAPELENIGMITDGLIVDYNSDGWDDVILVGDWMPIVMFENDKSQLANISKGLNFLNTEGWWNAIESDDVNKDGFPDFVIGNHGQNSFFSEGDRVYISDFDGNGSVEQIFCTLREGRYYPIHDKDELLAQIPSLKKDFLYFKDYKSKAIDDIFKPNVLAGTKILEVKLLNSILLLSGANGYQIYLLPPQAQYSPVHALLLEDLDGDGISDLIVGGNQYQVKPQFGRYDASECFFFKGKLTGQNFTFDRGISLGVKGQVRDIQSVDLKEDKLILFAKYDDNLDIFKICNNK